MGTINLNKGEIRNDMRKLLAAAVLASAAPACTAPPAPEADPPSVVRESRTPPATARPEARRESPSQPPEPSSAARKQSAPDPDPVSAVIAARAEEILAEVERTLEDPAGARPYRWLASAPDELLFTRFAPPDGYRRRRAERGDFAEWLRHLPLREKGAPVRLHDGSPKSRQDVHAAVIDIDTGRRDLQQCADAVMRLRAEYLFSSGRGGRICFRNVRGEPIRWSGGARDFRRYLNRVFAYANSASLMREMEPVPDSEELRAGDVFIQPAGGGAFGHAVIVLDTAVSKTGEVVFLLAQSYMPAQDIHVLRNPESASLSPWYDDDRSAALETPEWRFAPDSLYRFSKHSCPVMRNR